MSTGRQAAAVNQTLTNFAAGVAQDRRSALAEFLAPTVRVPATIGQYKEYDEKNAFQIYSTARALGGPATRIKFEATDPTFNCKPHALEIPIDDSERDAAGESDPLGLEESKIETLVTDVAIAHEDQTLTIIKAGLSAVSAVGVWSDAANDPIAEIDDQIEAIATACGMMPNAIALGLGAWAVLRHHPKVVARQPGAQVIGLSLGQFTSMLLNPGIEARVGVLSKDTTKFGKTASKTNIVGAEVFIFLRSDNPTTYDPSFAKTFMGGTGGISAVREYRDESARSDVYAVDFSKDTQVVSTIAGRRLTIS